MPRVLLVGWREPSARALARQGAEVFFLHEAKDAAGVSASPWAVTSTVVDDVTDVEETLSAASQESISDTEVEEALARKTGSPTSGETL